MMLIPWACLSVPLLPCPPSTQRPIPPSKAPASLMIPCWSTNKSRGSLERQRQSLQMHTGIRIGRDFNAPRNQLSYAENFLYMLDAMGEADYRPHPVLAKCLDRLFIIHAEHEMNCSTAAMLQIASSGVDPYSAVAGAAAALFGPLHGGANEVRGSMFVIMRRECCRCWRR